MYCIITLCRFDYFSRCLLPPPTLPHLASCGLLPVNTELLSCGMRTGFDVILFTVCGSLISQARYMFCLLIFYVVVVDLVFICKKWPLTQVPGVENSLSLFTFNKDNPDLGICLHLDRLLVYWWRFHGDLPNWPKKVKFKVRRVKYIPQGWD